MNVSTKHEVAKAPASKTRIQFNLLSILLLLTACAVWSAYRSVYLETREIQKQLPGLRFIARELVIENPNDFAAVQQLPTRFGEMVWHVYVPEVRDRTAQIAVAMDKIPKDRRVSEMAPLKTAPLEPGKHEIQLLYEVDEAANLTVFVDDKPALEIERAKDWIKSLGNSSSSDVGVISKPYGLDHPFALLRRHFSLPKKDRRPSDGPGILLWIHMK